MSDKPETVSNMVANMVAADDRLNVVPDMQSDEQFRALLARGTNVSKSLDSLKNNVDNPRTGDVDVSDKVASYLRHGFDVSLGRIVIDENDTILRGHLRVKAAKKLRDENPTAFAEVFPNGEIPCIVLAGLTPAEKIDILSDHGTAGDRRPLSAWETMLLISTLIRFGRITADTCGKRFGQSRQWADKMIGLAKLPENVRLAFRPCMSGDMTGKLRSDDIVKVVRDFRNNRREVFDSQIWPKWLDGSHGDSAAYKSAVRAEKRAGGSLDLSSFRETAEVAGTPASLADVLKRSETADAFRANVSALATVADTVPSLTVERDTLRAEVERLTAEVARLTAELASKAKPAKSRKSPAAK